MEIPHLESHDVEFQALLRGWWLEYTTTHAGHASTPGLYWETAKVVLRGHIVSYANKLKHQVNDKIYTLGQTLHLTHTSGNIIQRKQRHNGIRPNQTTTLGLKKEKVSVMLSQRPGFSVMAIRLPPDLPY